MGFAPSSMTVTSSGFGDGGEIPPQFAGVEGSVSPPLAWSGTPEGAKSFAVFCHDPDAPLVTPDGGYGATHWVLYNIPPEVTALDEGATNTYTSGPNAMGGDGYIGPEPPPGHGVHHYYFWVLALGRGPDLPDGLGLRELLSAVEDDVIGMSRLVGTFSK